jgi:hypothetical protein
MTRMTDIRLLELLGLTVNSNSWKGMATRPRAALGHGRIAFGESARFALTLTRSAGSSESKDLFRSGGKVSRGASFVILTEEADSPRSKIHKRSG